MTPIATRSAHDVAALNKELDDMILAGKALEAFERFYAEDVVMQEGSAEPVRGKTANRKREEQFFASVEAFHGAELLGNAASGDRSYAEWEWDVTLKDVGRVLMTQVAVRQWADGKIVSERFYKA